MPEIVYVDYIMPRKGKRPTTDAEAVATCTFCRHYEGGDTCPVMKQKITVASRHACYRAGYSDVSAFHRQGKVSRKPPCP